MFRWQELADGRWLGVDGDHWYLVRPPQREKQSRDAFAYVAERRKTGSATDVFEVESNAREEDFIRFFRLDWDAQEIEREILKRAPEYEPYLGSLGGLRLLRPSDPVEMFFSFLCTPNNNLKRITSMVRHLASYGPDLAEVEDRALHRFPEPETIASINPQELRSKAFGYRADTITSAARQVVERGGRSWIESLKAEPYEQAHEALVSVKGIGNKLADCIALFALDKTEAVPVDTHIWQAVTRLYYPEWKDKAVTDQRYKAAAEAIRSKLGPLTAWGHQYLFYDNLLNWRSRRK